MSSARKRTGTPDFSSCTAAFVAGCAPAALECKCFTSRNSAGTTLLSFNHSNLLDCRLSRREIRCCGTFSLCSCPFLNFTTTFYESSLPSGYGNIFTRHRERSKKDDQIVFLSLTVNYSSAFCFTKLLPLLSFFNAKLSFNHLSLLSKHFS